MIDINESNLTLKNQTDQGLIAKTYSMLNSIIVQLQFASETPQTQFNTTSIELKHSECIKASKFYKQLSN